MTDLEKATVIKALIEWIEVFGGLEDMTDEDRNRCQSVYDEVVAWATSHPDEVEAVRQKVSSFALSVAEKLMAEVRTAH